MVGPKGGGHHTMALPKYATVHIISSAKVERPSKKCIGHIEVIGHNASKWERSLKLNY